MSEKKIALFFFLAAGIPSRYVNKKIRSKKPVLTGGLSFYH